MTNRTLLAAAGTAMAAVGSASAQPYHLNGSEADLQRLAHARLRVTIGSTTHDLYDINLKHQDYAGVASQIQSAMQAAGFTTATCTYRDSLLHFYSPDGEVRLTASVHRDDEAQHLISFCHFTNTYYYPNTYGVSTDVFNNGDWSGAVTFGNYAHLIGDLGIKRHLLSWPFGMLPDPGYLVGYYPIGGSSLYCSPMGPQQLAQYSSVAIGNFASGWSSVVSDAKDIGGEVICYFGAVPLDWTSDPMKWVAVATDAGMSIALDVMGAIDTTTTPAPPTLDLAAQCLQDSITLYGEPHDQMISQLEPWHQFGAVSNYARCDLADQGTGPSGWYFAEAPLDNINELVGGSYDNIANIKADAADWIRRGWTICFPMQAYLNWDDADLIAIRDQSWDADLIGEHILVCYANCDESTTAPVLNSNDFACFLNLYASGSPRANCDGSTVAPVLNSNDFACFLNRYAAGCP